MFGRILETIPLTNSSATFVSQAAIEDGLAGKTGHCQSKLLRLINTRGGIQRAPLIHNNATPDVKVDPEDL